MLLKQDFVCGLINSLGFQSKADSLLQKFITKISVKLNKVNPFFFNRKIQYNYSEVDLFYRTYYVL